MKIPRKVNWFGSESTREEEEGWRNLRPMSWTYLFPYLTPIPVHCQTQFSERPQMLIPVIHLRPQTPGGQERPVFVHFILFKFGSVMNGEALELLFIFV